MKKGDKVYISDGSYMMTTVDNKLKHNSDISPYYPGLIYSACRVIVTNIVVPIEENKQGIIGDTIIKDNNGQYWFCNAKINLNTI
jgi:hypothetical protein